jgi:hypothetical protein
MARRRPLSVEKLAVEAAKVAIERDSGLGGIDLPAFEPGLQDFSLADLVSVAGVTQSQRIVSADASQFSSPITMTPHRTCS